MFKDKGYQDTSGTFERLWMFVFHKLENSLNFEKTAEFFSDACKQNLLKEVYINLDTLVIQAKYSTVVKYLLNNKNLVKNIHDLYKDENLSFQRRRNFATVYNNLTKNSYNVDNIIQDDPDTFKAITLKSV